MTTSIGPIIFDLKSTELSAEEREMLQHPLIGGVIFFTRNYESTQQIAHLCKAIRSARKNPILITVDQEGGRVQRFREGFTRLPPMKKIGDLYSRSADKATQLATLTGWLLAFELLSVGIDLSFAPVLDLQKNKNDAIGDRAFHPDPSIVSQLALALIAGLKSAGMSSVGKHFPGHGSVVQDSHFKLPIDNRSMPEIENDDLLPFKTLLQSRALQGIMAAHILFPEIDNQPVGFSQYWLKTVLREQLNYSGMIFSDDLSMKGASCAGEFPQRAQAALNAGCDMILICNERESVIKTLDNLPYHTIDLQKFSALQGRFSHVITDFKISSEWTAKKKAFEILAHQADLIFE